MVTPFSCLLMDHSPQQPPTCTTSSIALSIHWTHIHTYKCLVLTSNTIVCGTPSVPQSCLFLSFPLLYIDIWEPKNWCFWTVVLKKTLESPLDYKEIQSVNPKGNQSWMFIGNTDAEAETPIFRPPDGKNWLVWKTLMLGKIEGWRRRGRQRMRWLDGITTTTDMSLSRL